MKHVNDLYKYLETTSRFTEAHDIFTPRLLVEKMLTGIDTANKKIFVLYNVEFVISLIYTYKVNPANILFYSDHVNKSKMVERMGVKYTNSLGQSMKFDVIVGNPPYQDGSKDGGQNKIYNQISKTSIDLLTPTGIIAFVTPTSVLKKSKRFSLVGQQGLKIVDFTADDHFNVGIQICWWMIDKSYSGDVSIIHQQGSLTQPNDQVIHNYSKIDKSFADLYEQLKTVTDTPDKRMFKQNNFGPAMTKVRDADHPYPLHKLDDGTPKITFYSSRVPYFVGKNKFTISMTKGFTDEATVVGFDDYDVGYLTTEIVDQKEVDNIKSFIFSDYFIKHSERWKIVYGYGYNYALKYLPPFDRTIKWDDASVEAFLESFRDVK
jgi:hypothetical protein